MWSAPLKPHCGRSTTQRRFARGALLVVNLGDDADTTGAIYGQLAGAFYGLQGIPKEWRECIIHARIIENFADALLQRCEGGNE